MSDADAHSEALEARITAQRFEFKYAITEVQALAIRDYIVTYMSPDLHLDGERDYPLVSLYYDNPRMATYHSSEAGEKNRFKLRARAYLADEVEAVYLEVKRRTNLVLRKHRARLSAGQASLFFEQNRASQDFLDNATQIERNDFYTFRDLMDGHNATPRVLVRYRREAYVAAYGEPVRITFDRALAGRPCFTYRNHMWTADERWYDVPNFQVALEIKFTDSFPNWVHKLIQRFNLSAQSICKYALCVKEMNRNGIYLSGTGKDLS